MATEEKNVRLSTVQVEQSPGLPKSQSRGQIQRERQLKLALTEWEMAVAMGLCVLMEALIPELQIMTACIAVLLCTQESLKASWKSGVIRLIITAIGGTSAVLVVLIQEFFTDALWLSVLLIFAGALLTFFGCRIAKVPIFSNRIGAVTFILVVFTKPGIGRITFALTRLLSTFAGILIVMLVVWFFQIVKTVQIRSSSHTGLSQRKGC